MVQGYVTVPHSTYDIWRRNTIGKEYNVDGQHGCQCWDYASLLWWNVGFGAGYPLTGPNHSAYECWSNSRYQNTGDKFELVELLSLVKKGDVIVLDRGRYTGDTTGHIAFADEDYNGTSTLRVVGQNQENASATLGYKVTANSMSMTKFLGAFRLKEWKEPPKPPTYPSKSKFPWFLYANKRRNRLY